MNHKLIYILKLPLLNIRIIGGKVWTLLTNNDFVTVNNLLSQQMRETFWDQYDLQFIFPSLPLYSLYLFALLSTGCKRCSDNVQGSYGSTQPANSVYLSTGMEVR